jgi:hypothetical protein
VKLDRARYLVSREGRAALEELPREIEREDPTRLAALLRRTFPPEAAGALAEQVGLRARARFRFGEVPLPLFTAAGLEMMTHPLVARRRAARLAGLGMPVIDLTCGLGGDLAAVAALGVPAAGIERDPATAALANANVPGRVALGDALHAPLRIGDVAVLLDPGRRDGGRRNFDPAAFSPPWDACVNLLAAARAGVIKAPPGIDYRHVPSACEVEAVQVGRGLRELSLWAGEGAEQGVRRAVLLPGGYELDSRGPVSERVEPRPGRFVYDPESCVTRAGLVQQLAAALGAWQLDEQVAYLAGDAPALDPLCATFEVVDVLPFGMKRLRDALRGRGWRPGEVRRRAFPVEPDELRRQLGRLPGTPVDLLCTTIAGKRMVLLARRVLAEGDRSG